MYSPDSIPNTTPPELRGFESMSTSDATDDAKTAEILENFHQSEPSQKNNSRTE